MIQCLLVKVHDVIMFSVLKSHPSIMVVDSVSRIINVCFTCKVPRVSGIVTVLHGDMVLPSALTSWVPLMVCTGLPKMCSLLIPEHDAFESSKIDVCKFSILPSTYVATFDHVLKLVQIHYREHLIQTKGTSCSMCGCTPQPSPCLFQQLRAMWPCPPQLKHPAC